MKKTVLLILFLHISLVVFAQNNSKFKAYIAKYSELAIREQYLYGIPASIKMAQGLLESAAGESMLATKGNNHFGIKCGANWTGKTINKDDDNIQDCFRKYAKVEESYSDHSLFLKRPRYAFLFDYPLDDYKSWAEGLKRAGYATDKNYAAKLIKIIEDYNLNALVYEKNPEQKKVVAAAQENAKTTPSSKNTVVKFLMKQENNGVNCYLLRQDATIAEIAAVLGKREKSLLRYNDMFEDRVLKTGTYIYIAKKASKFERGNAKHVVSEGESMHSIAQRYGITLKSLYKINGITYGAAAVTGQTLFLR